MPKYFTQRDGFRCGAIAYLNLLSWLGYRRTRKDITSAEKAVKCEKNWGTDDAGMHTALKKLKSIKVVRRWSWTNKEIIERLHAGKPIIFSYFYNEACKDIMGHICFIEGYDKESRKYLVANFAKDVPYALLTKRQLLKFIAKPGLCWFITKK